MTINEDVRELAKWLNEQPAREINRTALARVLTHLQQAEQPDYSICPTCGGMAADPSVPVEARQKEPVALANHCRVELVTAIHTLASAYENMLFALRDDAEALKAAKGDIAHAMSVAAQWNWNGGSAQQPMTKDDVRRAGGIVHSDGNVFFTSLDMLNKAITGSQAPTQQPLTIPEGYMVVPVDRSYDMRVQAMLHFNTAHKAGADRDDCLEAAWQATLAAARVTTEKGGGT